MEIKEATKITDETEVMLLSDIAKLPGELDIEKYPCGLPLFDDALEGGFREGDLVIISGQTGQGKTLLAQNFAINFAKIGLPVLFLSYEVLVSHLWNKFKEMGITDDLPIYSIQRNETGSVDWIEKKIKSSMEKHLIKVVIIDHLGFLIPKTMDGKLGDNYSAYITQIVRDLKTIAKQNKLIIILPTHLRKTSDPTINDLKDSSGIGQESDSVFLLNRERNYDNYFDSYYTAYTKIYLAKNRATGIAAQGCFQVIEGQFVQDKFHQFNEGSKQSQWRK